MVRPLSVSVRLTPACTFLPICGTGSYFGGYVDVPVLQDSYLVGPPTDAPHKVVPHRHVFAWDARNQQPVALGCLGVACGVTQMGKRFNLIPQCVTSRQLGDNTHIRQLECVRRFRFPASGFADLVGLRYPGNLALTSTVLALICDYGLQSPAGGVLISFWVDLALLS